MFFIIDIHVVEALCLAVDIVEKAIARSCVCALRSDKFYLLFRDFHDFLPVALN